MLRCFINFLHTDILQILQGFSHRFLQKIEFWWNFKGESLARAKETKSDDKMTIFLRNLRKNISKILKMLRRYQHRAEMGPRGSVWADTWPKSISMHPGSFLKTSRALGRLIFVQFWPKRIKNRERRNPHIFPYEISVLRNFVWHLYSPIPWV